MYAAGKTGSLINVSSNASWRYIPERSAYPTTKVAMNNLSEYVHRGGESKGIRCVAMHPGGVITEMTSDDLPEDIKRILIDKPALPGATGAYLSTDRARFLGGRFVLSTWDMEELEKLKERIENEGLLKRECLVLRIDLTAACISMVVAKTGCGRISYVVLLCVQRTLMRRYWLRSFHVIEMSQAPGKCNILRALWCLICSSQEVVRKSEFERITSFDLVYFFL